MINQKEIYHNLRWWKFSEYVWDENDDKSLHIKPAPGAELITYNPWEINENQSSGKYPMPIYGKLIRDNLHLVKDYLSYKNKINLLEEAGDTEKVLRVEIDFVKVEQALKRNIHSFVKEFGLLGIFWQRAKRVIHETEVIPYFIKRDKFDEKKNNYQILDKEIKIKIENIISEGYQEAITSYDKNKKVPKEFRLIGFFIGHMVEHYNFGTWETEIISAEINKKGKDLINKFDKKILEENFFNNVDFPSDCVSKQSIAGVYYNSPYSDFKIVKFDDDNKDSFTLNIPESLEIHNLSHEFFKPFSTGCFHFPMTKNGITNRVNIIRDLDASWKAINKIKFSYSESLNCFIEFIIALNHASQKEDSKKSFTEEITKVNIGDARKKKLTKEFIEEVVNPANQVLNSYLDRNTIISDYSNKNSPYSFISQSLSGILANLLLWDSIGGKNMKACSNPKCKKYYFDPGNKQNCSDKCRQASARYRRKDCNNNLLTSNENLNKLVNKASKIN